LEVRIDGAKTGPNWDGGSSIPAW